MSTSQTPRCEPPSIVTAEPPKKTTVRGVSATPGEDEGVMMKRAQDEFREKFAHTNKSQIRSLISMLIALNNANMNYKIFLLRLEQGSRLEFNVNQTEGPGAGQSIFVVDKERVEIGFKTFVKGLQNLYYYFKFRGTKRNNRTGNKVQDNLNDLASMKGQHRHIWIIQNSALDKWLSDESNFGTEIRDVLDTALPGLLENDDNDIRNFKGNFGSSGIRHILASTVEKLFNIVFNRNQGLKIPIPKGERDPRYQSTPAMQQMFRSTATRVPIWSDSKGDAVNAPGLNVDPSFTVSQSLQRKIDLRREHGQMVYTNFSPDVVYMKQIKTIESATSLSSDYMKAAYENYKNAMISSMSSGISFGEQIPEGTYVSFEEFRGDFQFGQQMVSLQQRVQDIYTQIRDRNESVKPQTIRAKNRVDMASLLSVGTGDNVQSRSF